MSKVFVIKKENIKYSKMKDIINNPNNDVSMMIKELFKIAKLDVQGINTNEWNPLKSYIKKNDTILIKPNMVLEKNQSGYGEECLYTNVNIVFEIVKYCLIALKGTGKIIIADAPVQQCDFNKFIETSGYKDLYNFYLKKGANIELKDLRGLKSYYKNGFLIQDIDKSNGIVVDLASDSEQDSKNLQKLRITNYNPEELLQHHTNLKHEYCISSDILSANVIINIPKPKSHRKAGCTIGMKNFVGANVRKEYLPHHKMGNVESGGDEYQKGSKILNYSSKLIDKKNLALYNKKYYLAKLYSFSSRILSHIDKKIISKEIIREGSWYGNDTIWRTIIDVNKIVYFANKDGIMQHQKQRKILNISDMIVVGEKEGPLMPSPKYGGIISMSDDILSFDLVNATLMGFDYHKIPLYRNIFKIKSHNFFNSDNIEIISNDEYFNEKSISNIKKEDTLQLEPSSGWKNHIEME